MQSRIKNVITKEEETALKKEISAILSEKKISEENQIKIFEVFEDLVNCVLQSPTEFQPYLQALNKELMSAGLNEEAANTLGDQILNLKLLHKISERFEEKPTKNDIETLELTVNKILAEEKIPQKKHEEIMQTVKNFFNAAVKCDNVNPKLVEKIFSDFTSGIKNALSDKTLRTNLHKKLGKSEISIRLLSDFKKKLNEMEKVIDSIRDYLSIFEFLMSIHEASFNTIKEEETLHPEKLSILRQSLPGQKKALDELTSIILLLIQTHPDYFPVPSELLKLGFFNTSGLDTFVADEKNHKHTPSSPSV